MLSRNLNKFLKPSLLTPKYFTEATKKSPVTPKTVVLLPGDGIGPEITESVIQIFDHLKIPINWERHQIYTQAVTKTGDLISDETIEAIKHHGYGLKGVYLHFFKNFYIFVKKNNRNFFYFYFMKFSLIKF